MRINSCILEKLNINLHLVFLGRLMFCFGVVIYVVAILKGIMLWCEVMYTCVYVSLHDFCCTRKLMIK
jgi:hypothetical protein